MTVTAREVLNALRNYTDRLQKEHPRRHVMVAFVSSVDAFDSLYCRLAE